MRRACRDCEFWDLFEEQFRDPPGRSLQGDCRRVAPRVCTDEESATETYWPQTSESDWCGDFVKRGRFDEWEAALRASARP